MKQALSMVQALANITVGTSCPGCDSPGWGVCRRCRETVESGRVRQRWRPGLENCPLWSANDYDQVTSQLIVSGKDDGRWQVLGCLSRRLALAVAGVVACIQTNGLDRQTTDQHNKPRFPPHSPGPSHVPNTPAHVPNTPAGAHAPPNEIILVPVPSVAGVVRERGRDVVRDMSTWAAHLLTISGLPARVIPAVRHRRMVVDQHELSAPDRHTNLAGAMEINRNRLWAEEWLSQLKVRTGRIDEGQSAGLRNHIQAASNLGNHKCGFLRGHLVIVVDDVVTTGASLAETVRALRSAGIAVDGAATVAST